MDIKEIRPEELKVDAFIAEKVDEIASTVGDGLAVNALSGGVDSSVVTLLGHRALADRLKTYFVDNGLMREGEPEHIVALFKALGVKVELYDAKETFFDSLRGLTDPEEKREAITRSFYKTVFGDLVKKTGANYLLQGTNYTDIEETVAGIKRQHNILEQIGIDPQKTYGYRVIEPLLQIRKPAVREVGRNLGLPEEIYSRPPFPGPAPAARMIAFIRWWDNPEVPARTARRPPRWDSPRYPRSRRTGAPAIAAPPSPRRRMPSSPLRPPSRLSPVLP